MFDNSVKFCVGKVDIYGTLCIVGNVKIINFNSDGQAIPSGFLFQRTSFFVQIQHLDYQEIQYVLVYLSLLVSSCKIYSKMNNYCSPSKIVWVGFGKSKHAAGYKFSCLLINFFVLMTWCLVSGPLDHTLPLSPIKSRCDQDYCLVCHIILLPV